MTTRDFMNKEIAKQAYSNEKQIAPFIKILEDDWIDNVEIMSVLTDEEWEKYQFP